MDNEKDNLRGPDAFDFVIVGAGAAGCVLANRLSGLPQAPSVCLIERGPPNPDSRWNVAMPAGYRCNRSPFANQSDLWLRTLSVPEKRLNGRRLQCPRGTGWGGGSIINGMGISRGQPEDYNHWAKEDFCSELWSYDKCLPYFKRLESYNPGIDAENAIDYEKEMEYMKTIGQYRGFDGPLKVSSGRLLNHKYSKCPYFPAFILAGMQAGHQYNPDSNCTQQEGIGWLDFNIADGLRQSTSRCYLLPALSRKNLTVVSNALVSRVILEDKRAVGVQYTDSKGIECIDKARHEVILSAGALNSPQILMLSGIGDPVELRKVGIEPLHELPGVGRSMLDHTQVILTYDTRRSEFSYPECDWQTINTEWTDRMRTQWESSKDGPGATVGIESTFFFRTNEQVRTPNIQTVLLSLRTEVQPIGSLTYKPGMSAFIRNQRPLSTGHLKLQTKNPADDLIIEHNYFTDQSEVQEFVDAINIVRNVFSQPALAEYIGEELSPGPSVSSSAALDNFIHDSAKTGLHWTGTCRMGDPDLAPTPEAARQLVVDAELRVCGIDGLRVADASIMPSGPSGNIMAPILMVAERASDFIEAQYLKSLKI